MLIIKTNLETLLLCGAVELGHHEIIQTLIDAGADVNHQTGADVNHQKFGDTALMQAAERGHLEIVLDLSLMLGADVNHQNHFGQTALIRVAYWGYLEITRS